MAKSANQKMKLLKLMKIFMRDTDTEHKLTLHQIIEKLQADGIKVERKTVYTDMDLLRDHGMDIRMTKTRTARYYLASRDFDLSELKLLVDAVQSSRFITEKKSGRLIKKLEMLLSRYEAEKLDRDVVVSGRIKNMNESIYTNVDRISEAINKSRKISFKYFKYDINKNRKLKKNGKMYTVSPLFLHWDHENYYLVGYCHEAEDIRHYRVDRMLSIYCTDEHSYSDDITLDRSAYTDKIFSMFAGEEMTAVLEFDKSLVSVVIDRFGKSVEFTDKKENTFRIKVNICVSDVFFGWLFQFGNKVKIISPKKLKKKYLAELSGLISFY